MSGGNTPAVGDDSHRDGSFSIEASEGVIRIENGNNIPEAESFQVVLLDRLPIEKLNIIIFSDLEEALEYHKAQNKCQ